jgi:transcriptional regulator with XRE-family HTH domain
MSADHDSSPPLTPKQAFGRVLQQLRHEHGVSQEQLGFEAGFHRTYISMLERGQKSPSLGAIFQLSKTLQITPSDLIRQVEVRVGEVPDREIRSRGR